MAASIALKDASTPRGNPNYAAGQNFLPGRTVNVYVNGQFAGVQATGPYGTVPYASIAADINMPSNTSAGAAKPVLAQDNTLPADFATTTVTLT